MAEVEVTVIDFGGNCVHCGTAWEVRDSRLCTSEHAEVHGNHAFGGEELVFVAGRGNVTTVFTG